MGERSKVYVALVLVCAGLIFVLVALGLLLLKALAYPAIAVLSVRNFVILRRRSQYPFRTRTLPTALSPLIFGEIIAMGTFMTAQNAMDRWMNSQGHRDNILKHDYKTLGVGCVSAGDIVYWVQLFGY